MPAPSVLLRDIGKVKPFPKPFKFNTAMQGLDLSGVPNNPFSETSRKANVGTSKDEGKEGI